MEALCGLRFFTAHIMAIIQLLCIIPRPFFTYILIYLQKKVTITALIGGGTMKRSSNRTKSVTMADIADALGVSNVTVSNALAGKKGVSEQMRSAVELKAREMGYLPAESTMVGNGHSASAQTGDVGIISPQRCIGGERGVHWQLYQELIGQLKAYNSYAILDVVSEADENAQHLPRIVEERLVSGLIMLGRPNVKLLNEIGKKGLPVVFLNFSMRSFNFPSITGDDYYDINRLTAFLISHGHTRIAYVSESDSELNRDRYFGYCRAMTEIEIEPSKPLPLEQITADYENQKPTAFVCESRPLAERLIRRLEEMKISVPDMASVACYSDIKPEDGTGITCISRDTAKMARFAVEALRGGQENKTIINGRIAVSGKLTVGSTTRSIII